jgi:choice-of-anchor A domain-containing protein
MQRFKTLALCVTAVAAIGAAGAPAAGAGTGVATIGCDGVQFDYADFPEGAAIDRQVVWVDDGTVIPDIEDLDLPAESNFVPLELTGTHRVGAYAEWQAESGQTQLWQEEEVDCGEPPPPTGLQHGVSRISCDGVQFTYTDFPEGATIDYQDVWVDDGTVIHDIQQYDIPAESNFVPLELTGTHWVGAYAYWQAESGQDHLWRHELQVDCNPPPPTSPPPDPPQAPPSRPHPASSTPPPPASSTPPPDPEPEPEPAPPAPSPPGEFPALGAAGKYAVFALNGSGSQSAAFSDDTIAGSVAVAPRARVKNRAGSMVDGSVFVGRGGSFRGSGQVTGRVLRRRDLASARADALAASGDAAALDATKSYDDVTAKTTVRGRSGLNVVDVSGAIDLVGESLTLRGPADARFVVNVAGPVTLGRGAAILAGGSVRANHVLINASGAGRLIDVGTGSTVEGTLLAPNAGGSIDGTAGSILLGDRFRIGSGAQVSFAGS